VAKKEKKIEIKCTVSDYLPLDELTPFQGRFKQRTEKDIKLLVKKIETHGFFAPFFVWQKDGTNLILDGHGRYLALDYMRSQGYELPSLPVILIEADDEKQARMKVLEINNVNGTFSKESVLEFSNMLAMDYQDLHLPGVDFSDVQNMFKPALNPVISTKKVSEGDVDSAAEKLAKYKAPEDKHDYRDVKCPHCASEFSVRVQGNSAR